MKHNGHERHRVLPRYGGHNGAPSVHGCQPRPDNIEELIAFHRERVEREEAELKSRHKRSEQTCAECCETTRDWRFLGQAGGILCRECVKKRLGREAAIHERFMRQ